MACTLPRSGPITVHKHNAVVENLHVHSDVPGQPAIRCKGARSVTLRRLRVEHHAAGIGILFEDCDDLSIEEVTVAAVPTDDMPGALAVPTQGCTVQFGDCDNIRGVRSKSARLNRVHVSGGATGIELTKCFGARLTRIVSLDVRGPFPRGQCVQFSQSPNSSLDDFLCRNGASTSWTEDSVSVWRSAHSTVSRGLVDGNNSPSGVAVMFENSDGAEGGAIRDVDAIHQGDGCFSGYPAKKLAMDNTRCGWTHCGGWGGRPKPLSTAMWAAGAAADGTASAAIAVRGGVYWETCSAHPERTGVWQKAHDRK